MDWWLYPSLSIVSSCVLLNCVYMDCTGSGIKQGRVSRKLQVSEKSE